MNHENENQEIMTTIEDLVVQYFEERNMDKVQEYLEERTSWIGTGDGEESHNLEEARDALTGELAEFSGKFTIIEKNFKLVPLSDSNVIVHGKIKASPDDHELSDEDVRISAVFEKTKNGPKLVHIHFSHADIAQEEGKYFVKRMSRCDNTTLRKELSMRERQLASLIENIPGGAHQCAMDSSWTLLFMSEGFLSMFGYTKAEVNGLFNGKFINMIYPGDRAGVIKRAHVQLEKSANIDLEYRVLCKNGQPIWVLDKGRLVRDENGNSCFYCILIDITERKCQEEELRLSLERHQVIMDQTTDIIFEWDIVQDTLVFSPNWKKKFGYEAIDKEISGEIPLSDNIKKEDKVAFIKLMKDTAAGIPYSETEFRIRDSEGTYYWCRIRATTQYDSDRCPIKAIGVIVDIDEEKRQKQALVKRAQQDALTGIYNKETINSLVEQEMKEKNGTGNQALFIIDIDYFKIVNDTYGHLSGDTVLSNVASALKSCTRSTDLVGRIGGDEFLVYMPNIQDEKAAQQSAERILRSMKCIQPKEGAPPITCSMGAVVLPHEEMDYQTLFRYADQALYRCKSNGRRGVTFYAK